MEVKYGIGWDVRGWQSSQQVTAVARYNYDSYRLEWIGISKPFAFEASTSPDFSALITPAIGGAATKELIGHQHIAIAIDAPLAFPKALQRLLGDTSEPDFLVPEKEIENPLAYRACELES